MTELPRAEDTNGLLQFVWTNDDIEFGKSDEMQRQIDFPNHHGILGVFFVIPGEGDTGIDRDTKLGNLMRAAAREGHEFYQHGFRHHAFECGIPDMRMFALAPEALRRFDEKLIPAIFATGRARFTGLRKLGDIAHRTTSGREPEN